MLLGFDAGTFDEELVEAPVGGNHLVAIDDALKALSEFDERKARVVELRYFGGLSVKETAWVLNWLEELKERVS